MPSSSDICVLIPVYNHAKQLQDVVEQVLTLKQPLIIVNDGSTDGTQSVIDSFGSRISSVTYPRNRGKGYALKLGFAKALSGGFTRVITMDADGQHLASDLSKFVEATQHDPQALLIGSRGLDHENMPGGNKFANKFSNFWFTLQTATRLPDTQSGFRLYPLTKMQGLRPTSYRYEAELELLVRAAWRGINIKPIPINVYYPPVNERVTHFRKKTDFFRITLLNVMLCLLALVYGYPRMAVNAAIRGCQKISNKKKI